MWHTVWNTQAKMLQKPIYMWHTLWNTTFLKHVDNTGAGFKGFRLRNTPEEDRRPWNTLEEDLPPEEYPARKTGVRGIHWRKTWGAGVRLRNTRLRNTLK